MHTRFVGSGVTLALGLTLAACGTAASPSPTAIASQMPMESGGMEVELGALGEAADASDADRTVHIIADDQL